MARDPRDRFADAREIADALRAHARHRASRALSQRADAKRAELAGRVSRPIADAEIPALYALLAECRFGYAEALREWPENDSVPHGIRACHAHAVSIEIARRDPTAARRELAAIGSPDPALESSVDALERDLADRRAEDERVRALARVADSRASPGSRIMVGITGAVAAAVISISIYVRSRTGGDLDATDALMFSVVTLLVMIGVLATFGRRLWDHPFNRRLAVWAVVGTTMIVVDRAVGVLTSAPVSTLLAHDLVLLSATFAAAAVFSFRVLWSGAAICALAAIVGSLWPDRIVIVFGVAVVLAIATIPLAAGVAKRASAR